MNGRAGVRQLLSDRKTRSVLLKDLALQLLRLVPIGLMGFLVGYGVNRHDWTAAITAGVAGVMFLAAHAHLLLQELQALRSVDPPSVLDRTRGQVRGGGDV